MKSFPHPKWLIVQGITETGEVTVQLIGRTICRLSIENDRYFIQLSTGNAHQTDEAAQPSAAKILGLQKTTRRTIL